MSVRRHHRPTTLPSAQAAKRLAGILCVACLMGMSTAYAQGASAARSSHEDTRFITQQAQVDDPCAAPANPIVAENCQPGSTDWVVTNAIGDIEGFAYPTSVNKGETVTLFVNTNAARYDIMVFRSGYYGGAGGRLMQTITDVAGQSQPTCNRDIATGLTSCSNWAVSYTLEIPEDWISGVYTAKLVRPDTGGEGHAVFVVRDDARDAAILYQQSLFTYHAYNNYGGKSVYDFNSGYCLTDTNNPRASKVSFHRPHLPYMGDPASYWRAEFAMVRWLEAQGYDVTYSTNLDTHRSGKPGAHNELMDHQVFLSVGHDEYWSQEIDDAITAARDAGVHLGFFSANTSYWRVRLEPDPWTGESDSVMVTYKTTESGPPDPSGHPTGTFRDPAGVNDPENGLLGVMYIGDNDHLYFPLRVSAEHGTDRIYRHTDLQSLPPGTYVNVGDEIFGWEWDARVDNGHSPDGLEVLAETPVYGLLLQDAGESENATSGEAIAHTARYVAPSGALVFASGTIQWSWGLGAKGIEIVEPDPYIQQITYNVLADMGVQPATPSGDLVLDGDDRIITVSEKPILAETAHDPVISNIQVHTPTDNIVNTGQLVTLTWETDVETVGQVWLGTSSPHTIEPAFLNKEHTRDHTAILQDLVPGTTYYYRILAVDRNGNITGSDEGAFQTPANVLQASKLMLRGWIRTIQCWVQTNPLTVVGIGVVGVLLAAFIGWRLVIYVRGRNG